MGMNVGLHVIDIGLRYFMLPIMIAAVGAAAERLARDR